MQEFIDIIIFIGQSNMQGSTGEKDESSAVDNAYEYKFLSNSFVPLKNPVGEDIDEGRLLRESALKNGSLVPAFCKTYCKKTKQKVIAIHTAKGNSSIIEWQKGTERFDAMIRKIKAGIKKAKENFSINKTFIVWLQGESDALKATSKNDYVNMLVNLKNEIRKEIEFSKFTIIRQGYFAEFAPWIERPVLEKRKSDKEIMNAFDVAIKTDSDFFMLTKICAKLSKKKKYLNPKEYGPHYNNLAMEIIGKKAGSKLSKLRLKQEKKMKN